MTESRKRLAHIAGLKSLAAVVLVVALSGGADAMAQSKRRVPVADVAQLQAAVSTARPGDLISIAPGRYGMKLRFTAQNSGSIGAPLTIAARDGMGTVVIDGAGYGVTVKFSGAAYIRITALDITGGGYHGVVFDHGAHDIIIDGNRIHDNHARRPLDSHAELKGSGAKGRPHRIAITNNEIFHSRHPGGGNFQGIDCNFCTDFLIAGNDLHDIGQPTTQPYSHYDRGSCIQMKSASRNTVIERNRIARCHIGIVLGGEGMESPEHIGGVVRENLIYDSGEIGIAIVNATGAVVSRNTLLRNGEAIRIARDGRHPKGENKVDIVNNILDGPIRAMAKGNSVIKGNNVVAPGKAKQIIQDWSREFFDHMKSRRP